MDSAWKNCEGHWLFIAHLRRGVFNPPLAFFANRKERPLMLRTCIFNDGENLRHAICDLFDGDLFDKKNYLPSQADWTGFFNHLVGQIGREMGMEAMLVRAYWYVVGAVDANPWLPAGKWDAESKSRRYDPEELEKWRVRNQRGVQQLVQYAEKRGFAPSLSLGREGAPAVLDELHRRKAAIEKRFQGFAKVQSGIARRHRRIEFRRSGGIGYDLFRAKLGQEKTTDVNLAVDMMRLRDVYDIGVILSGDQDFLPAAAAVKDLGKTVVNVSFKTKDGNMLPSGARRLNEVVDWSMEMDYGTLRDFLFPPRIKAGGG